MSATVLKLIAVITMVIDHVAGTFISNQSLLGQIMHGIGRLTFPIMAYFIAEGFNKTSDIKAYIKRMGIFALISHIPYRYFAFGADNIRGFYTSIIFTFFISLLILYILEKESLDIVMKSVWVIILFALSILGDYSIFGPLLVIAFHKGYGNRKKQLLNGLVVTIGLIIFSLMISNFESLYMIATIIPLILLTKYNGKRGYTGGFIKYSFYIIYPLQFVILGLLEKLIK